MYRVALCVIFFALCLNGSQISAAKQTEGFTESTTEAPKEHEDNTDGSKQDITITTIESNTEASVTKIEDHNKVPKKHDDNTDESNQDTTTTEPTTEIVVTHIENQNQTERTARSISNHEGNSSIDSDSRTSTPPKYTTAQNQKVEDIAESLLMTIDDPTKDKTNSSNTKGQEKDPKEGSKKVEPSYIGKLTDSLITPALKAQNRWGKAWNQASQGVMDVGGGTYEAAAGTINFLKSAASALFLEG